MSETDSIRNIDFLEETTASAAYPSGSGKPKRPRSRKAVLAQTASHTAADSSTVGEPRLVRADSKAIADETRRKAEAEMIDALMR